MYKSKFEAYPFLSDDFDDLRCDFEILSDEIASYVGFLRSVSEDEGLKDELLWICELIYHLNPSLRTKISVTEEELNRLENIVKSHITYIGEDDIKKFTLPLGCCSASVSHIIRSKCKALVRLLYRHNHQGNDVENILFDFINLLSDYFFYLSLTFNKQHSTPEITFTSRNYKVK